MKLQRKLKLNSFNNMDIHTLPLPPTQISSRNIPKVHCNMVLFRNGCKDSFCGLIIIFYQEKKKKSKQIPHIVMTDWIIF